jgi:hypothetical protein
MSDAAQIIVSEAKPMFRRFLDVASIVCLVLCVALMGMWLRSEDWSDDLYVPVFSESGASVGTLPGRLVVKPFYALGPRVWVLFKEPVKTMKYLDSSPENKRSKQHLGFGFCRFVEQTIIVIPFWFLLLVCGSLAMLFQLRRPWRFGLRSLFVATMFLAVLLGMIAWLDRAWIGK